MQRWKERFDSVLEKSVVPAIAAAAGAVLTTLGRQLSDSLLLSQLVQPLFTAAVVVATPFVLLRWTRRRGGWALGGAVILATEFTLLLAASLLIAKRIAIDGTLPRDAMLESQLVGTFPQPMRRTAYNEISVVRRPLVVTDGHRATYVVFDFLWTKRDGPDRTYAGRVALAAAHRPTATGGWSMDPFSVRDMSFAPKQGWTPYLLGWLEAPLLLAENGYFADWISAKLPTHP